MNYCQEKKKRNQTSNVLQKRLIIMTLSITLSIGVLISGICTSLYRNYTRASLIRSAETNLKFLTDSIDANLESVFRLVRWSQSNTTIGHYISTANDGKYGPVALDAHDRLTEEYQNSSANSYLHRIVIGNHAGRYIQIVSAVYSSNYDYAAEIPALSFFDTLYQAKSFDLSTGFIKDPFYPRGNTCILPIIRPIYAQYNSNEVGWIFIEITPELFCSPVSYYSYAPDTSLYLMLGAHTYLLSENGLTPCDAPDKNTLLVSHALSQEGCYVAQTISQTALKSQYPLLFAMWTAILALMLSIGLLLNLFLRHAIAVPVARIRKQIDKVSVGNFLPDHSIEWNNELGDIGRGINAMAGDIEKLMEKRILDEQEKKDLEYRVLQSQINPHFLYNTLNSIKWMAAIQGASGIADMTTSLSRLLRSISKGTKLQIPLSEELSLVQDYFNIQKYRYGGTITMDIHCPDETLLSFTIIKFTLQPIVENAIFHGIEPKGSGHITITVHTFPENPADMEIIVHDNGVGISPDKTATLLESNEESTPEFFKEIGVSNVHKRLQYEYGKNYGIHIESKEGEYTSMHIVIPKRGGCKHV